MKPYEDVMVDLETLGVSPGCKVLSIGAVAFNADGLGPDFHMVISINDQQRYGLTVDPSTVSWWQRQTRAAQLTLDAAQAADAPPLRLVLEEFRQYLQRFPDVKVWGNGADFDNALTAALYRAADIKQPWHYHNSRCYRTLKNLMPSVPLIRQGTHHNALDDAKTQALHAVAIGGMLDLYRDAALTAARYGSEADPIA